MDKPLRILAIVNVPWDPRLGAARVWIELTEEWSKAGHYVEKFCLTDAFPDPAASPAHAALRLIGFPQRAARFIRQNAERFDVIDALVCTVPFSKRSLEFRGLLVARSVGLFYLYEKFERMAAERWAPAAKGKLLGRPFYWFFNSRARTASQASLRHCDLLNLPNSDELACVRNEIGSTKPAIVQPYGLRPELAKVLENAAADAELRWNRKKIAFIGMWSVRKGARDWAEIVRQVRARVPEACFLFLGTMMANENVWNDLELPPGTDFIEIVPQFDPEELPRFLSDCTVGAFPSYVEGFGMAVVEQLAAGLPTVAYDAPGPRDILRQLPELLVPAGDVAKFSETISAILTGDVAQYRELRDRSAAAAKKFSWADIARDTAAEYRNYLDNARA